MSKGRFTIPTDESFVEGTKIIAELFFSKIKQAWLMKWNFAVIIFPP